MTTLKELKKGDVFKRKEAAKAIYVRGDYIRREKRFECTDVEDICRFVYLPGNAEIFTEFEY